MYKLNQKLELSEKAVLKSKIMEEKIKDFYREEQELSVQIPVLIEQTKEIQRQVSLNQMEINYNDYFHINQVCIS